MALYRFKATLSLLSLVIAGGCTESSETSLQQKDARIDERPAVISAPEEGLELWYLPTSRDDLGEGALINIKIDRVSVPYTSMMVVTQTLAADGIPVHLHTFEDELIYVASGHGKAIVGDDRKEIPIEPGSVLYVPTGQWHGVSNADPDERMEVLVVTTPVSAGGLGDFFRKASVRPGHPPLDLSEEEFLALFSQYGMEVPE